MNFFKATDLLANGHCVSYDVCGCGKMILIPARLPDGAIVILSIWEHDFGTSHKLQKIKSLPVDVEYSEYEGSLKGIT